MTDAAMLLAGNRVIVIGGASGIGFAVVALSRDILLPLSPRDASARCLAVGRQSAAWPSGVSPLPDRRA